MRRGYVDAPWGQVHYYEVGAGPAVLLYPNRPRSGVVYRRLAGLLAGEHRTVIIDPPGFGASDPLPEGFEVADLTAAVIAVLDGLGIDDVRVSGHHTGAAICIDMAANHPERTAAIAPSGLLLLTDEERRGRLDRTLWSPAFGNPAREDGSHLLPFIKKFPPTAPEDLAFLNDEIVDELVGEANQVSSAEAVYRYPEREHMARVTTPTLFLQSTGPGEPPTVQRSETAMDLIPGSEIVYIEGGDIHFHHHRADEVSSILLEFFSKVDSAAVSA